ncbi:MAG: TonB-dependent receptor, partial [Planctomycetes bacterium]|nr:TonB-dependent receptor [Planctomycetota bacterium]
TPPGGATEEVRPRFPNGSRYLSLGVYLTDDWKPNNRWIVDGGARFSHFRFRSRSSKNVFVNGAATVPDTKESFSDLTFHSGVTFAPNETFVLVGRVARGFRAPTVFDLGQLGLTGGPDQGIIRDHHNCPRLPCRQNRQLTRSAPWVLMETVEPIHEIADPAARENCPTCIQVRADREANAGTVPRQFSQGSGVPKSPLELGDVFGCLHLELEAPAIGLDKPRTSTGEKAGLLPFRPNQAPKRRLV